MYELLADIEGVAAYMDNMIVYRENREVHEKRK